MLQQFGFKFINIISDFVTNSYMVSPRTHQQQQQQQQQQQFYFKLSIVYKACAPIDKPMSPSSKRQRVLNWKYLGLYSVCDQSVNLETDAKTLYHSLLKLKYSPFIYLEHKKTKINMLLKTTATEITQTRYSTKKSSHWAIVLWILRDACLELHVFCVSADFYASGMQDAEVTKLLHHSRN